MVEMTLSKQTQALLEDPLFGEQDINSTVRRLVEAEYLRQIAQHRRMIQALAHKYDMDFDQFVEQGITARRGYSWEVEQDAMHWESAIGGMMTAERKLRDVRSSTHD